MKLARILRDYSDAGGVNTLLPLWGFVDDHTFMTKAGRKTQTLTDARRAEYSGKRLVIRESRAA